MYSDMNHLVIGMSLPFLTAMAVYFFKRGKVSLPWLIMTPVTMAIFMFLAVAPDVPRLFGHNRLYQQLAAEPWTNVFFWHYTLDRVETDSQVWFFLAAIPPAVLLAIARRILAQAEKE